MHAPQQILLPERLAEMWERDDDALSRADERSEFVLRLGQAAGDKRGPLRLERERLSGRKGVEQRRLPERHSLEALLLPHRADFVGLPDEIRPRRNRTN